MNEIDRMCVLVCCVCVDKGSNEPNAFLVWRDWLFLVSSLSDIVAGCCCIDCTMPIFYWPIFMFRLVWFCLGSLSREIHFSTLTVVGVTSATHQFMIPCIFTHFFFFSWHFTTNDWQAIHCIRTEEKEENVTHTRTCKQNSMFEYFAWCCSAHLWYRRESKKKKQQQSKFIITLRLRVSLKKEKFSSSSSCFERNK